jgi:hypothetical protein
LDGTRLYAEVLSFHRIGADPQHRNPGDQSNRQTKAKQQGRERSGRGGTAGVDEYRRPGRTGATVYLIIASVQ